MCLMAALVLAMFLSFLATAQPQNTKGLRGPHDSVATRSVPQICQETPDRRTRACADARSFCLDTPAIRTECHGVTLLKRAGAQTAPNASSRRSESLQKTRQETATVEGITGTQRNRLRSTVMAVLGLALLTMSPSPAHNRAVAASDRTLDHPNIV